ncbi:NfeD family protein [Mucisphaera sp.]|uniref:NfeD family protein n=1 Tax=Mucisphaera sp. TaxID=2913024 RepID=UPI003D0D541C
MLTALCLLAQSQAPAASGAGSGGSLILWGVILIAVGLGLVVLEFFVPSAGVLALAASASLVVGIVMLFISDTTLGLFATLFALVLLPVIVGTGLRILPHTPVFRMLTLGSNQEAEEAAAAKKSTRVGQEGVALKDLRPVGMCEIGGERIECLAQGGVIDAGSRVRVVSEDAFQVKVAAVKV